MSRRVSSEVFQDRLNALVARDGRDAVVAFYTSGRGNRPSVTARTVDRWISGATMPQNAYVNRSVSERGRGMTGNVIQGRYPTGTIVNGVNVGGQLSSSRSINQARFINAYNRGRENRRSSLEAVRTQAEGVTGTASQRANYQTQLEQQENQDAALFDNVLDWREYYAYLREFGEDDLHSWDDWREIYGAISG